MCDKVTHFFLLADYSCFFSCRVVALDEIKGHFPPGTTFEDYWPAKGSIEPLHSHGRGAQVGGWTQKPPNQAGGTAAAAAAPNGVAAAAAAGSAAALRHPSYAAAAAAAQQQQHQSSRASAAHHQQQSAAAAAAAAAYAAAASDPAGYHQLLRSYSQQQQQIYAAAAAAAQQQAHHAAAAAAAAHAAAAAQPKPAFPGRLTQIKEFPVESSVSHQSPYKLQKALIDQKIVPCINVRPFVFHDLMMTLPDFLRHFCPDSLPMERVVQILQDILKIVLYKGNR